MSSDRFQRDESGSNRSPPAGTISEPNGASVVRVPDHDLLRCIGRGSYGEVWLARSVLGMLRAVKTVHRSRFRDARPYEREFSGILRIEPLSRAHDGLVDILHVGRHEPDGYFYYVMELADDAREDSSTPTSIAQDVANYQPRTLAWELKRRGRLPFDECLQLGLTLSSALGHLHQAGLVHRDVKPSNTLYVAGVPKLGDIGLVGETGESGSYVGTEGYISPEGPGTPRADIFSLGKVLYEAATGMDRQEFPLLPQGVLNEPSDTQLAELNAVFLKACAPDPRSRYATAEELHDDLTLLRSGESVRRRRRKEGWWRSFRLAVPVGTFVLGLGAGVLWSPLQHAPARQASAPVPAPAKNLFAPRAIDLTKYHNATLDSNWMHDMEGNDLGSLPVGWQRIGPACFDVRGIIQLTGGYLHNRLPDLPAAVNGIAVGRSCRRLHFLHGTAWTTERGRQVGSYVVHFADGRHEEIPLRYGEDFENWWWDRRRPLDDSKAILAWTGTNSATAGGNSKLRLYSITWNNPTPNAIVSSLDFLSTRTASCPFLIAVTAE